MKRPKMQKYPKIQRYPESEPENNLPLEIIGECPECRFPFFAPSQWNKFYPPKLSFLCKCAGKYITKVRAVYKP